MQYFHYKYRLQPESPAFQGNCANHPTDLKFAFVSHRHNSKLDYNSVLHFNLFEEEINQPLSAQLNNLVYQFCVFST